MSNFYGKECCSGCKHLQRNFYDVRDFYDVRENDPNGVDGWSWNLVEFNSCSVFGGFWSRYLDPPPADEACELFEPRVSAK